MTSSPLNADPKGIWGTSSSNVFAGAAGGNVLHYDGTTWSVIATGSTSTLSSVWGFGPADVYLVRYGTSSLLHYP